jgi:DNA-binding CsgD family transcriptional regulator
MHVCQACHQRAATEALLCRSCLDRQDATIIWPQVRLILLAVATLCAQADPQPILQARHTFLTAVRAIPVTSEAVTPLPRAVPVQQAQQTLPLWRAYEGHAHTYRQQVGQASPAWEFWLLLQHTWLLREYNAYLLRARDGFDVTHWHWWPGFYPLTAEAWTAHRLTRSHYETCTHILRSGALTLLTGLEERLPLLAALQRAAHTMREAELTSLLAGLIGLSARPPSTVQRWAQAALACWVRVQIRVFPSLRKALAAQQISERHLVEFLIERVGHVLQAGVDTPHVLVADVQRAINALRQTGRPRGRPRGRALTPTRLTSDPKDLDQAALQTWRDTEHIQRLEAPVSLDGITLTPQEQRVWDLYIHGETSQDIAQKLGTTPKPVTPQTVRVHLSHIRKKLQGGKRQR